mgnify:CR=1 FL=1|tara:strand:+ start:589 stop:1035 length:447 start_codon:yes stop_codon:yes gene_type:complete
MNKYTIQFNIVAKGVNEMGDKFTHNFFNYLDNWGNDYFEAIDDTEEEEYIQAWEDVEFHVKNNGLLSVFNQGGMEALTPVWRITNINASIYGDLWEEIVDEIAQNSSWYFMNITGYNMTIDLIEDGKGAIQRFELGEYIQNKALEGRY